MKPRPILSIFQPTVNTLQIGECQQILRMRKAAWDQGKVTAHLQRQVDRQQAEKVEVCCRWLPMNLQVYTARILLCQRPTDASKFAQASVARIERS